MSSTSKPLGRVCLFWGGFLATIQEIQLSRAGTAASVLAREYISWVDEERYLTPLVCQWFV